MQPEGVLAIWAYLFVLLCFLLIYRVFGKICVYSLY